MQSENFQNDFKGQVLNEFSTHRVICILFYGSNAFNRSERKSSDYDFFLLLDKYEYSDVKKLRKLVTQNKDVNIDLTYQYLDDLERKGWDNYQLGNHGLFYILNFAQSITLYGVNIFQRRLSQIDSRPIINSIVNQIQEYFWRLDDWAIKESTTEGLIDKTKKYSIRIVEDIMLITSDICFTEINSFTYKDVALVADNKNYFSNETKVLLKEVFVEQKASEENLIYLKRSLYEDYLRLINDYVRQVVK